jgi:hypothetical protein
VAETVELPGIGQVKTEYVWAGGAAIAGFVTFAWWRARTSSDTAPIVLDPNDVVPEGEHNPPPSNDSSGDYDTTEPPRNNAEWSRAATEYLSQAGYDPKLVAGALGKFLQRAELSASEADAVRAAVAVTGYPPDNGPWPIKLGGSGDPADPEPSGELVAPANLFLRAEGRDITAWWPAVPGVERYLLALAGFGGQWVGRSTVVSGTSGTFRKVAAQRRHSVVVWPLKPGENNLSPGEKIQRPHTSNSIAVGS